MPTSHTQVSWVAAARHDAASPPTRTSFAREVQAIPSACEASQLVVQRAEVWYCDAPWQTVRDKAQDHKDMNKIYRYSIILYCIHLYTDTCRYRYIYI